MSCMLYAIFGLNEFTVGWSCMIWYDDDGSKDKIQRLHSNHFEREALWLFYWKLFFIFSDESTKNADKWTKKENMNEVKLLIFRAPDMVKSERRERMRGKKNLLSFNKWMVIMIRSQLNFIQLVFVI